MKILTNQIDNLLTNADPADLQFISNTFGLAYDFDSHQVVLSQNNRVISNQAQHYYAVLYFYWVKVLQVKSQFKNVGLEFRDPYGSETELLDELKYEVNSDMVALTNTVYTPNDFFQITCDPFMHHFDDFAKLTALEDGYGNDEFHNYLNEIVFQATQISFAMSFDGLQIYGENADNLNDQIPNAELRLIYYSSILLLIQANH